MEGWSLQPALRLQWARGLPLPPSAPRFLLGSLLFGCYRGWSTAQGAKRGAGQGDKASLFSVQGRELAHLVLGISPGSGSPVGSRESIEGEGEGEEEGGCCTAGERKILPKCLNFLTPCNQKNETQYPIWLIGFVPRPWTSHTLSC